MKDSESRQYRRNLQKISTPAAFGNRSKYFYLDFDNSFVTAPAAFKTNIN
jgi:hypothetical protein